MKTALFIGLCTSITLMNPVASQAKTWQTQNGMMSDTCFTRSGVYFVFSNYAGYVGNSCSFRLNGDPTLYVGVFG
jgi:hypothetical protein